LLQALDTETTTWFLLVHNALLRGSSRDQKPARRHGRGSFRLCLKSKAFANPSSEWGILLSCSRDAAGPVKSLPLYKIQEVSKAYCCYSKRNQLYSGGERNTERQRPSSSMFRQCQRTLSFARRAMSNSRRGGSYAHRLDFLSKDGWPPCLHCSEKSASSDMTHCTACLWSCTLRADQLAVTAPSC
jgi:hypothetical protein